MGRGERALCEGPRVWKERRKGYERDERTAAIGKSRKSETNGRVCRGRREGRGRGERKIKNGKELKEKKNGDAERKRDEREEGKEKEERWMEMIETGIYTILPSCSLGRALRLGGPVKERKDCIKEETVHRHGSLDQATRRLLASPLIHWVFQLRLMRSPKIS